MQDPGVVRPAEQLWEQWLAFGAAAATEGGALALWVGADAGEVHEEAQLMVDVELGVLRLAETHLVALSLLVVFALVGDKGRADEILLEAFVVVRVED